MYTPSFFYTTCTIILITSVLGVFRYGTGIARTNDSIINLKQQIITIQTSLDSRAPLQRVNDIELPTQIDTQLVVEEDVTTEPEQPAVELVLPSNVHLTVPFTSQAPEKNWEQPWQDACEEAAILMLDAYYKGYNLSPFFARDELIKMVQWQEAQGWGGSIDIVDIQSATAWYMQASEDDFQILRYPTVEEIKAELAAKHPVLAVADGTVLPNPHFSGDGPEYHALVIIGYDDSTGEFITNDPGTQHGKDFRYVYDDLMHSLRDWNNGDVKNGVPVVLVKK